MAKKKATTGEYLPKEDLSALRHEIRQCWRTLGMLQLRMQNDISRNENTISIKQMAEKISTVSSTLIKLQQQLQEASSFIQLKIDNP